MSVTRHTRVRLARHPQTDWNREGRHQSRSDRPLTDFGRARAEAVSSRLRRLSLTVIVSTGLTRTDELASTVAGLQRREPGHERDERLREADHGLWEGLTYSEVAEHYGDQARERFADPWSSRAHGGESMADLWMRVGEAWRDLLRRHDGGHALVVAHAAPIRLVLCYVLGVPFERGWQFRVDLGGVTSLDLYPSGAVVRTVNEVPPLERAPA